MAHKSGCTKSPCKQTGNQTDKQTSNQTGNQSCDDPQSCIFCPLCSFATFTSVTKIEVPEVQVKKHYNSFLNGMISHYSSQCFKPPDCA